MYEMEGNIRERTESMYSYDMKLNYLQRCGCLHPIIEIFTQHGFNINTKHINVLEAS